MYNFTAIENYLSTQIAENVIPGAVLLINKDKELYEKAFGSAQKFTLVINNFAEKEYGYLEKMSKCKMLLSHSSPMTTKHVFDLASITKIFTTISIMLLFDQKKIELDIPLKKYLPEFDNPDKQTITIRHLLSHTSGLKPWKPLYYHVNNKEDAIKFINQLPLEYPVGTQRIYSDLGFIVLGYLIERITQQPFNDFLQENLFEKLHLNDTCFNAKNNTTQIAATSHGNPFEYKMIADENFGYKCDEQIADFKGWRQYTLKGEVNDGNAYHVCSGISGHAGVFSTAADVNKVLQLMINKGYCEDTKIIEPETIKLFTTKDQFGQGLGWSMSLSNSAGGLPLGELADSDFLEGAIGHTGFTGTYVLAIPAQKLSIVLLTNLQNLGVNADGKYNNLRPLRENILKQVVSTIANIENIEHPTTNKLNLHS